MKKSILIAFILVFSLGFAQAQTKDKDALPKEIAKKLNLK